MIRPRGVFAAAALTAVLAGAGLGLGLWPRSAPSSAQAVALAAAAPAPVVRQTALLGPAARPPILSLPGHPDSRWLRVPVLMYHRVVFPVPRGGAEPEWNVAPAAFAAQMNWLERHGYHPVSEATLFMALARGGALPSRPVLLTVDDGYVDAVHAILQSLVTRTRHWPATFFVITGRIGKGSFLGWSQLDTLEAAGMDIGSHTVWHTKLALIGPAAQAHALAASEATLARGLGHPVYWFAYPYGSFDASVAAAAAKAGYLLAYTTQPGSWLNIGERTTLPRLTIPGSMTLPAFAAAVSQVSGA